MIPKRITPPAAIVVGALVYLLSVTSAPAAETTADLRLCAARDLDVVILIEEYGALPEVAAERLAKAAQVQIEARNACSAGNTEEAIALYDEIVHSLNTVLSHRPQ
jgi:hypothetical protein